MPEMPEIEAHAERLEAQFGGRVLTKFVPFNFTALKTAVPAPDAAYGFALQSVGRRGKYLLLRFEPITFVIHLMQGGRLLADTKLSAKPRGGQARFVFEPIEGDDGSGDETALLLTEQGKERRAGVWCVAAGEVDATPPVDKLGPEAAGITADELAARFAEKSMRVHGFLRDQRMIAGIGRRLANEICWTARVSPFATTKSLGADGAEVVAAAIATCVEDGLAEERERDEMSSSKQRTSAVHNRTDDECPRSDEHGPDTIRAVEYSGYTVNYCPTCQTGGKILADNTTSKFLK
ncbi:DNA-formamidopyrimidine glycosylase family protein [Ilumatobacter nonamiensis]|uniref:DNA-formamidopyrimidine glycosylase family protein n=1 Tax=Ilumatobacter nonamiensis TaxID=467093 RepID=UPI000349F73E|nr:DNA-formamidopyrimidine glycosylase family protein [Ilumatobacter nonamiensis]